MSFTKVCISIPTKLGHTYCEVYTPARSDLIDRSTDGTNFSTILMVHGLGGSVEHWSQSELPYILADQGHTVVCFDWYSHGKSTRLSSKTQPHNLDLYCSQMADIINCPKLPIVGSNKFVAHGFSMGCYILLQYCVRFEPFSSKTLGTPHLPQPGPHLKKIILQSPWDGHIPLFLRGLLHIPLLLRVFKPSDMAEIKSIRTLKEILLWMDRGVNYKSSLKAFADLVLNGRKAATSEDNPMAVSDSPVAVAGSMHAGVNMNGSEWNGSVVNNNGECDSVCQVLLVVGTREPPFAWTAKSIAKYISMEEKKLKEENNKKRNNASTVAQDDENYGMSVKTSIVQLKFCKYAGHMCFAKKHRDSYVRRFFKKEIIDFVGSNIGSGGGGSGSGSGGGGGGGGTEKEGMKESTTTTVVDTKQKSVDIIEGGDCLREK